MLAIEQLIGDLLLRHNCVIIPSFGGFVASNTAATIDYTNGVMQPPKKSLLFNRQLINNDGLLVSELSRNESISFDSALHQVESMVNLWNETLRKGERVNLDRIGHLYLDGERNICFEQDRFFNLLLESYGLGKVQFIAEKEVETTVQDEPVIRPRSLEKVNEETELTPVIEHPALKKQTKVWRYVAAACLLPIAFYSFWLPMKTDVLESGLLSFQDFNPFHKSSEAIYKSSEVKLTQFPEKEESLEEAISNLPEDVTVFSYQFDEDLYIPVKVKEAITESTDELPNDVMTTVSGTRFQYIVGCFGDRTNAENLVKKLRSEGLNASIAGEAAGLTRVSAGGTSTEAEMNNLISKANSLGYNGWVLK